MAKNYEMGNVESSARFSGGISEEQRLINEINKYSDKKVMVFMLLSLFPGFHWFYAGKPLRGILNLLTMNFLVVGMFVDWILLWMGKVTDSRGKIIHDGKKMWAESKLQMYYQEAEEQAKKQRQIEIAQKILNDAKEAKSKGE